MYKPEQNDIFLPTSRDLLNTKTKSNHSGGIQGGISNGQNILFRVSRLQTELIGGKILDIKSRREYEPLKVRQCYPMSK